MSAAILPHDPVPPNVFSGLHVERVAHRRRDAAWIARTLASPNARLVPVQGSLSLLADGNPPRPLLLDPAECRLPESGPLQSIYLGRFGGHECFACAVTGDAVVASAHGGEFTDLHKVGQLLDRADATLLAYARAMVLWHHNHRHCARCGAPTSSADGGHVLCCANESCGTQQFPRLDPAIIVLVSDGERCLLGRQASWPAGRYSAIAGFVEPGESLEDAVAREVREETGVIVGEIRYHSSQPWPFPSSLMLGFYARAESTDIELVDRELEDARWFSREDLAAGRPPLPSRLSVSWRLIDDWLRNPGDQEATAKAP
ncbi:MAG TPA: NAD(+) diphosphatase [Gammaproteobacteria bacterium]|nr:NAD(+) diphosphatase [Gammaproteobacteria bacterium]